MFKKIAVGVVSVAAVGLLVAGAMNRTGVALPAGNEYGGGRGRGTVAESGQVLSEAAERAQTAAMSTVKGTVTSVDTAKLQLTLEDGSALELGGQPWRYAQSMGFAATVGDPVAVTGYYDGDHFEATKLTHTRTNATTVLRADDGTPKWSGRGRTN